MALTVADVRHEIVLLPLHFSISQIPRWHRTANRCGSNVTRHGFVYALKEIWTASCPWPFAYLDHIAVVRQCCRYMENLEFQL